MLDISFSKELLNTDESYVVERNVLEVTVSSVSAATDVEYISNVITVHVGSPTASTDVINALSLISTDDTNILSAGTDDKLFVPETKFANIDFAAHYLLARG